MVRNKIKWKCVFIVCIIISNVFTKSLPIDTKLPSLTTTDTVFKHSEVPIVVESDGYKELHADYEAIIETTTMVFDLTATDSHIEGEAIEGETTEAATMEAETTEATEITNLNVNATLMNNTRNSLTRDIRPGQEVRQYAIEITPNGNTFSARAVIDVILSQATREDPIVLHCEDLNIDSVQVGVFTDTNAVDTGFDVDDGIIEIFPDIIASTYIVIIEYTGSMANIGQGFYRGEYDTNSYVAMNLHPTNARRVFPCMDEPDEVSMISFTFNGMQQYSQMVSNSLYEDNSVTQFRALQGPPHLWGMVAHNFVNLPTVANVLFYARGLLNQETQASLAINHYFTNLNEWTNKNYFEIILNQDGRLHVFALPDVSRDWTALSTVGIWEPYVLMENVHSIKQRKTALQKIAEALARQWFGYVIYPENWRYEWVTSGLATYAGYEMFKSFQTNSLGFEDDTLLDVNTLFVTDIIQESLLRDAYSGANVLELDEAIFNEDEIRDHTHGLLKLKAPALMRMWRLVLGGPDQDFIQSAARALLNGRALQTVSSLNFVDALNSDWMTNGNGAVDAIDEYIEPWIINNGYPLLNVGLRQGGVLVTQERFSFTSGAHVNYLIPITYTTNINPNYDDIHPTMMMENTITINMVLDEEEGDYVLFNLQGQGYYRVNYDGELWDRIIEALDDPDRRQEIHPLNRATLVDDALNLARAGRLDYDVAFRVVLTMEHETEYAVWKAFVRNMEFLRKRLVALVGDDEDLDPDIYLRMVRRTVGTIENELTFYPDASLTEPVMTSLTRGLVMEHACRANYQPCIAAAVDWFYDPDNENTVNPNIPNEIRPAVYCTMVREGDNQVIAALNARLEIEPSAYERVVILESLACSQDEGYINTYLLETIASNSPYNVEERVKIFAAVAESSAQNAGIAINFIYMRVNEMRQMYGGDEKVKELIYVLAENMADFDRSNDFRIWVYAQNNNLDGSQFTAERALSFVLENMQWNDQHLDYVYEWIDENDAQTIMLSLAALCMSFIITLFNH